MTDNSETAQWQRMRFKRNKVWMALGDDRQPLMEKGKVLIKYQLDQSHQYWVHRSSVRPLDDPPDGHSPPVPDKSANREHASSRMQPPSIDKHKAICIYTDGASSGNPGPAGIGVVMIYNDKRREISSPIGTATNNVAELTAIRRGLAAVKNRRLPVMVFTDSRYAIGVLTQGWKTSRNQVLVADIRSLLNKFRQVQFVKIKAHAGHPENERADRLAVEAIKNCADR